MNPTPAPDALPPISVVDCTKGRKADFPKCRVCGKLVGSPTQHREAKHPEVTRRDWAMRGDWTPGPTKGTR